MGHRQQHSATLGATATHSPTVVLPHSTGCLWPAGGTGSIGSPGLWALSSSLTRSNQGICGWKAHGFVTGSVSNGSSHFGHLGPPPPATGCYFEGGGSATGRGSFCFPVLYEVKELLYHTLWPPGRSAQATPADPSETMSPGGSVSNLFSRISHSSQKTNTV